MAAADLFIVQVICEDTLCVVMIEDAATGILALGAKINVGVAPT